MNVFDSFKNKTTNCVSLNIYDFACSPEELTRQLGVQPTEVRIKGETRIIGKEKFKLERINKENVWMLKSELPLDTRVKTMSYIIQ